LKSCSEASFKHLKKYTAALFILIILWAFTGYCFAERYVHAPWWGCAISSFIFVVVVIQIERQIILTVGSAPGIALFRGFIAVIMSVIGSSIIDQIIFADDIDRKMIEITEDQVTELYPKVVAEYDIELARIQTTIDSLDRMNMRLNEAIANQPTIRTVSTETVNIPMRGPSGNDSIVRRTNVITVPVPNPRIKQVETNENNLKMYRERQKELTEKKMGAKEDLRNKFISETGFLEELRAMIKILHDRTEALIFYIIIFLFLITLELFVVFSKIWDKKCDYDLVVEHQLKTKQTTLEKLSKS
jgi:hypothetical protein